MTEDGVDLVVTFVHNKNGWFVVIPARQEKIVDFGKSAISPIYENLPLAMAAAVVYLNALGIEVVHDV